MGRKAVSGIMVTLIFMIFLASWIRLDMFVMANPIPIPSIWMPEEYIDAKISLVDGVVQARVNGTYPFAPLGTYYQVMMYYPVPPDADRITVEMNETKLDWTYGNETYPTVLGDWPMINWTVKPVPEYFEIETYYEHSIPVIGGNYTFLYAMGTGKYLDYYAKETIAYVSVNISKHVADRRSLIDVYTIGYNATTEEWAWNPADYNITEEDETWIVTLTVVSEMFHPLIEDLLITIKSEPTTWIVDDDGPADFSSIQEAVNAANPGDTIYVHNGTYYENVVVNKTVSLIGEDKYSTIIDGNSFGNVIEVTASNVKITGFTIQESVIFYPFGCGIYVGESSGNNISYNIITNNGDGIRLFNSSSNIISGNKIEANEYWGISLKSSENNRISGNNITNNDYGIELYESSNNSISGNNIATNMGGIWLHYDSSINIISGNNITNNWSGFWLGFGIGFMGSLQNFIYHNNFVDNYEGHVFTEHDVNFWDDGYPSGGNYWSDYEERYPDAEELDDSGIWNTPYVIDEDNQDNYPLMYPWGTPLPPSYTLTVYSSPTGVTFTVDVSLTTPWSGTYSENTSVSLIMPEIHTVGDARYYWNQWSDGNTSRLRTVTMTTNITLTAYYTGPYHELTVTSSPMTGIAFTINGAPQTTSYTEWLLEVSYTLEMPEIHDGYAWFHWLEDGDTNRIKTVTVDTNILLTAVFTPLDTTPPTISIVSPENKTYTVEDVPLTFTVSESTSWIGYSLDGQANITIAGNTTLSGLSDGSHNLIVYAKDAAGNTGASDMVYFSIETQQPDPFPWWILGAIAGIAVIGIALGTFFLRRRKSVKS